MAQRRGNTCKSGNGANSNPIGKAMGGPDVPGTSGNEIAQVYDLELVVGSGGGAGMIDLGFLDVTFNNQVWWEIPVTVPGYSGAVAVNMGNISISPGGGWMSLGKLLGLKPVLAQSGLPQPVINAASSWIDNQASSHPASSRASVDPCFSQPWDGSSYS